MLRSCLFAIISGDLLIKVPYLNHSNQIWDGLNKQLLIASFMKKMELRCKLTNLREVKDVVDSVADINSPLTHQELIPYIVDGLDDDYEAFITATTYFGGNFTFDDLRIKLILYKP